MGFLEGDRVEYVGIPWNSPEAEIQLQTRDLGWVIDAAEDATPPVLVVEWDLHGAIDMAGSESLRKVGQRNEPNPLKRLPGDPQAP